MALQFAARDVLAGNACADAAEAAQSARDERKLLVARGLLRSCAQANCPDLVRKDCTRWLQEVDSAVPRVAFRVRRAGEDVPAIIVLDGSTRVAADGFALAVDPGSHEALVEGVGTKVTFVAAMGDGSRVVDILIPPAPAPSMPTPVGRGPAAAPWTSAGGTVEVRPRRTSNAGPIAVLVSGGTLFGVGLVFGGVALTGWSNIRHDTCPGPCNDGDVDRARSQMLVADIAIPLGLVVAGVGTYWLLAR